MLQGAGGAVGGKTRKEAVGKSEGVVQVGMKIFKHEGGAALFLGAPQRMARGGRVEGHVTGLAGVDGIERSCLLHSPRGLTRLTFYVERNDKSQLAKKALGVSFS